MYSFHAVEKPDLYSYLDLHISQWSLFIYTLSCSDSLIKKRLTVNLFSFYVVQFKISNNFDIKRTPLMEFKQTGLNGPLPPRVLQVCSRKSKRKVCNFHAEQVTEQPQSKTNTQVRLWSKPWTWLSRVAPYLCTCSCCMMGAHDQFFEIFHSPALFI